MRINIHILLFCVALSFFSCSNTKQLGPDQHLYTGIKKLKIKYQGKAKHKLHKKVLIVNNFWKTPNGSAFGTPFLRFYPTRLWIYNHIKPKRSRGFTNWFHRNFGKAPVLLSAVRPEARAAKAQAQLVNEGNLHSKVWSELTFKGKTKKKVKVSYFVYVGNQFFYRNVHFPDSLGDFANSLSESFNNSLIKTGDPYNLSNLTSESERIARHMQNKGFFKFTKDDLVFYADTGVGNCQVDLDIELKENLPPEKRMKYTIGSVTVNVFHEDDTVRKNKDSIYYHDRHFTGIKEYFAPYVLDRNIYLASGKLYNIEDYEKSLSHLSHLGVFRFINFTFDEKYPDNGAVLNVTVDLTMSRKMAVNLEMNLVSKSNNFAGPAAKIAFRHRNMFKRAHSMSISLDGSYEWQTARGNTQGIGLNSWAATANVDYYVPQLLIPFKLERFNHNRMPRTHFNFGFELQNLVQFFRLSSWNASFGYEWKHGPDFTHILQPMRFNLLDLIKTTPEFDSLADANTSIKWSFQEQIILGAKYALTFDNTYKSHRHHVFYTNLEAQTSGNLLGIANSILDFQTGTKTFFGNPYSQFSKLSLDLRHYWRFRGYSEFASRVFLGAGIPYGNSDVLPYVEQFFAGGSNSVRAFIARSLGPGAYDASAVNTGTFFLNQTGDLRFEANLEYRFRIAYIFYGALFVDAGNIWLMQEDASRPLANFTTDRFLGEIAIGAGAGLRLDLSFFVLRWDIGFPLKKPFLNPGERWFYQNPNFSGGSLNHISIGYPF